MKAHKLGILSAMTASICCLGPLLLILFGLGSLGWGAIIARHHWYLLFAGSFLLVIAWRSYFKEKRSCVSGECVFRNQGLTKTVLIVATGVVVLFSGLNAYTYAKRDSGASETVSGTRVILSVAGMTCWTCEQTVQQSVRSLPGIHQIRASAKEGRVVVDFDPGAVSVEKIVASIHQTGFRAGKLQGE